MNEKCFCHLEDKQGNIYVVKDKEAREQLSAIQKGLDDGLIGVGIAFIEQTTTSLDNGGENVITVTLTNGNKSTFIVRNGNKGSDAPIPTFEISNDNYWIINGHKTEYKSVGEDGKAPYIQDGYWFINGESTGVKATGENGKTPYIQDEYWFINGESTGVKATGEPGKTPYIQDGYWYINGESTCVKVTGENGKTPYIQDGYWYINGESTGVEAKGDPGNTPYIQDGYWYIAGVSTGLKAKGDPGNDGVSITSAEINSNGELVLTFSDEKTVNVGRVVGESAYDTDLKPIAEAVSDMQSRIEILESDAETHTISGIATVSSNQTADGYSANITLDTGYNMIKNVVLVRYSNFNSIPTVIVNGGTITVAGFTDSPLLQPHVIVSFDTGINAVHAWSADTATTADSATKDGKGNVIANTYAQITALHHYKLHKIKRGETFEITPGMMALILPYGDYTLSAHTSDGTTIVSSMGATVVMATEWGADAEIPNSYWVAFLHVKKGALSVATMGSNHNSYTSNCYIKNNDDGTTGSGYAYVYYLN